MEVTKNYKKWTLEEETLLKTKYSDTTSVEIAKELSRSSVSIRHKAQRLGVRAPYRATYWRAEIIGYFEKLTDFEKGYLAGFVDGEGWIGIGVKKGVNRIHLEPCVKVSNTNLDVCEYVAKLMGACKLRIEMRKRHDWKPIWVLHIYRLKDVDSFLKNFKDLLVVKKKQAELLFRFCESRLSKVRKGRGVPYNDDEMQIYYELKKLNKRGGEGYLKKT